jgi:predicted metal-dependent phosphoesterase TrpH
MKTDLHIHSTFSDGELAPVEVLRLAAAAGLEQVSITDHDNVHAYDNLTAASLPTGMRLVPGVELDALLVHLRLGVVKVEVLGYGIDPRAPLLREQVERVLEERRLRGRFVVQYLNKRLGVTVWPDDMLRDNATVLVPRLLTPYMAKGHIADRAEARRLLDEMPDPPRVRKPAAEEAIRWIHDAGGRAVLAHPGRMDLRDAGEVILALEALRAGGLDGYEAGYPYDRASRKDAGLDRARVEAAWPDALQTCGSDAHTAEQIGSFRCDMPDWATYTGSAT